jgi:AraC-like DNA-binding protein
MLVPTGSHDSPAPYREGPGARFGLEVKMDAPGHQPGAVQRAGVFAELPSVLREKDFSVADVFAGTGVDPLALGPDSRVDFAAMLQVLVRAAEVTGLQHIGLICGLRFQLARHHGMIGRLMETAPTLRHALDDFVQWQSGYSSGAVVFFYPDQRGHAFGFGTYAGSAPGTRVLYDAIVGVGLGIVGQLTDGHARPLEIHFGYRRPAEIAAYARLLHFPLQFDQPKTCLVLDEEALGKPVCTASPETRTRLLAELRAARGQSGPSFADRTRHALRRALVSGELGMEWAASELGVHTRTMRRRLEEEATTFETLRDEVRFSVARELLEFTNIPVGEIANVVGCASPGVFSETFQRWAGATPTLWRRTRSFRP